MTPRTSRRDAGASATRGSHFSRGSARGKGGAPVVPPIFVVDDDLSVRKALNRLFRSAGYRVETFASASEFLAQDILPEDGCVVLDIRMPRISGLDLQQQLASRRPRLPVVVITGHADDEVLLEAVARAVAGRGRNE